MGLLKSVTKVVSGGAKLLTGGGKAIIGGAKDLVGGAAKDLGNAVGTVGHELGNAASSVGNAVGDTVKSAGDVIGDTVGSIKKNAVEIRDTAEAAAVIGGNYFLPGSSLLTSHLVSKGAQQKLNSDVGQVATLGSGLAGGYNGNMSNWTGGTSTLGDTAVNNVPVEDATVSPVEAAAPISPPPVPPGSVPVTDAVSSPVAPGTVQNIGANYAGSTSKLIDYGTDAAVTTYGAKAIGGAIAKAATPELVNPDGTPYTGAPTSQTTTPTSKVIDMTAGEQRATASDIANVMAFQTEASQRKRASGAAVLAGNTSKGSTNVGSNQLLGG